MHGGSHGEGGKHGCAHFLPGSAKERMIPLYRGGGGGGGGRGGGGGELLEVLHTEAGAHEVRSVQCFPLFKPG